jgi:hypothetical protein
MKKKIYINFDVLINNHSYWKDEELFEPKDGALDFIQEINLNYEILIFTTREPELIWKWLIKYGFDKYIKEVTNKKEPVYVYIDDRGINFNGDYTKLSSDIKSL